MRAAIYARFSSDKQKESSIEDQFTLGRKRALAEGFTVSSTYHDDGISGSLPVANRPGGAMLLADAMESCFEVLIIESLDRAFRDQVEQEQIVRRLEYRGIIVIGVSDGYDSRMGGRKIFRSVRGFVNELFLDDLREKTRRGMSGQVDRGYVAGGKSYGYDLIKTELGSHYEINEEQAKWVRWIFNNYAEGWSVQRISHELNRLNVLSPRGGTWAVSAIYGSPNKGSGILNNELYVGRYVWNRSQWVKDPDTALRKRLDRPKSEWKIVDVPDLRVVEQHVWDQCRARMDSSRARGGRGSGAPIKTLFGGLMTCPHCGGPIIAVNATKYGCANRKDRGISVCKGIMIRRDVVDKSLLNVLRDELLSPDAMAEIEEQVHTVIADRKRTDKQASESIRARMVELESEISRLVEAIADIGMSDALKSRLVAAESEKIRIQQAMEHSTSRKITPAEITAHIRKTIFNLQIAMTDDTQRARKLISDLMGEIQIKQKGDSIYAEIDNAAEKLLLSSGGVFLNMVAGAGFEPTTFGL